jgi:hypothetical protein
VPAHAVRHLVQTVKQLYSKNSGVHTSEATAADPGSGVPVDTLRTGDAVVDSVVSFELGLCESHPNAWLLERATCAHLTAWLDAQAHTRGLSFGDCKLTVTQAELMALIGAQEVRRVLAFFDQRMQGRCDEIKLRRVAAVPAAPEWIDFHTDVALKTMQVPLCGDDAYTGGQLVFARDDGALEVPARGLGSVTLHDRHVVHGVSRLTDGIRYGLFLLEHTC